MRIQQMDKMSPLTTVSHCSDRVFPQGVMNTTHQGEGVEPCQCRLPPACDFLAPGSINY
jgi:hypothetical protein